MNRLTLRTFAQATTCAALGAAFMAGCFYAATPTTTESRVSGSAPTPAVLLTSEQIDVLTESESADHPWEKCTIAGEAITCPDGYTTTWQQPPPDGAEHDPHAHDDMLDLSVCTDDTVQPDLPCRVKMTETYVVGGDGTVHDGCTIVVLNAEDSEMVCTDDTVWAS